MVDPDEISFEYTEVKSLGVVSGYNIKVLVGNDLVYTRPYLNMATLEKVKAIVDADALTTIGLAKQQGKKIKLDISGAKSLRGSKDNFENAFETLFKISEYDRTKNYCDENISKRIAFILEKKSSDAAKINEIRTLLAPNPTRDSSTKPKAAK